MSSSNLYIVITFFQNLKLVQARIQEIERHPVRTPKDESELAQLQIKQQQILASGRPVPSAAGQALPGTPISTMSQVRHLLHA
jgi:hypothetical protein